MATYLSYADVQVFDEDRMIGRVLYDAGGGEASLAKFGGTMGKIGPLVDEMLGPQYRVDVTIAAFRRRSMATRILFGAMAGADAAEGLVPIVAPGGETAGEWTAGAYNASAGMDEAWVANALADEIAKTLVGT